MSRAVWLKGALISRACFPGALDRVAIESDVDARKGEL